jgi:hypothetical protein
MIDSALHKLRLWHLKKHAAKDTRFTKILELLQWVSGLQIMSFRLRSWLWKLRWSELGEAAIMNSPTSLVHSISPVSCTSPGREWTRYSEDHQSPGKHLHLVLEPHQGGLIERVLELVFSFAPLEIEFPQYRQQNKSLKRKRKSRAGLDEQQLPSLRLI